MRYSSAGVKLVLLFISAWAAQCLIAQVDTGAISGTVTDSSKRAVQTARVRILHVETGIVATIQTNGEGFYSAPGLRMGKYNVSASADGFATETKTGIELRVQDRLNVEFTLVPGQMTTTVSVMAETPPLETGDSSMGQVVDQPTMHSLPLNGRNYIELATLAAGTSPSRRGGERATFIANGVRATQNVYLLDGADNRNKIAGFDNSTAQAIEPVLDAVREFKVQTSTFSAEFGQAAGAVVNVTMKAGTNRIHGSLFEYIRNSYFDATPYFQVDGQNPQFNQNQFGATVGGPIAKDSTFFFVSWQSMRAVSFAPQLTSVPTLKQRQGIFPMTIYDPRTTVATPNGKSSLRTPFPKNTIPAKAWDAVAAGLLPLYPLPNLDRPTNFFSDQKESVDNDQFNFRGDHHFRSGDSLFARASFTNNTNLLPAVLPTPVTSLITVWPEAHSGVGSETHIFRPNLINEARVSYLETRERQQVAGSNLNAQYGIKGAPDDSEVHGLPTFAIAGFATLGTTGPGALPLSATGSANLPIDKQGRNFQIFDNLSWVRGRHTLKFGVDVEQVTLYANVTLLERPNFNFTGVYTQNPQNPIVTGASLADFLLGWVNDFTVSTRSRAEVRQHTFEGYVQDDWKATSRLTWNLGLRYELAMPWYETAGRYANFILDPRNAAYGTVVTAAQARHYGYRDSFTEPATRNFAPRVGLAYLVTPRTVIRSGFGVFYGRVDENLGLNARPTNNPPFFERSANFGDQVHKLILLSEGLPPNALDPGHVLNPNVNSWPRQMPLPYTLEWNFNVQQELGHDFTAEIGYVGTAGHDLYITQNFNAPYPGPGPIAPRRPFPSYSAILDYVPLIRSNYHSMIVQVERRFRNGLSFLGAYTWSHSIDNGGQMSDADVPAQNPHDLSAERGSSNFDVRHRLSVSYIYDLPFGRGKPWLSRPGVARALLGGWELSGITSIQTGLPFTPILKTDNSNTGTIARPDVVPGVALYPARQDPTNWFNPTAFTTPAPFTYGNAGRDILRGPGLWNQDVGLDRSISIRERFVIRFSAQAFNVFNTPQFGLPNNKLGVPTTGVISTVITQARQLQLGLHLTF